MFGKLLIFAGIILALGSQRGLAISMDQPKALLQRGSYTKVTLNLVLRNISAADLTTYEMGKGESEEDGIRSLTKYLDICINTASGQNCAAGPEPKKVTYLNNTSIDSTPEKERRTDFTAGFTAGGTRFIVQEDDPAYRRLEISIELISAGTTQLAVSNYIALRLLPGTATNATNFLDREAKVELAVAANSVVESLEVRPSKGTLTATWNTDELISHVDNTQTPPDGALVLAIAEDNWPSSTIPLHTYNKDDPSTERTISNSCSITAENETRCSLACVDENQVAIPENSDHYLKVEDLQAAGIEVVTSSNTGNISIGNLENSKRYALIFQNQPDGLRRSCIIAQPSDAVMLTEIGGGPEPQVKDPRCFIATAAYGSTLHPHLNALRWFRDHVLLLTGPGQTLVQAYYRYSPPLAQYISAHPGLRLLTRGMLWLPVLLIELWLQHPALLLAVLAVQITGLLYCLRRRSAGALI